eukprot:836942_1
MLWLIFGFTITILINNVLSSTPIAGDTTWIDTVDNTEPNYYQTRSNAFTGDGDYWFYPEYRANNLRSNDQNGLAGVTGKVPGTNEDVWGWWYWWEQDFSSTVIEDPSRSMARNFECSSYGTVNISVDFFMCLQDNNYHSNTAIYMRRVSSFNTIISNVLSNRKYPYHNCWTPIAGSNAGPSGTNCSNTVYRCHVTDSFPTNGPGEPFILKFNWESDQRCCWADCCSSCSC